MLGMKFGPNTDSSDDAINKTCFDAQRPQLVKEAVTCERDIPEGKERSRLMYRGSSNIARDEQ